MKSEYWDESLEVQHRTYIQSAGAQASFDTFVDAAIKLPGFICHPDMEGKIRDFRYFVRDLDNQPFGFIVNREDLLFYVSKVGQAGVKGGFGKIRQHFKSASVSGNGTWTVRVTNVKDAFALQALLFHAEPADHLKQSEQLDAEISAKLAGLIPDPECINRPISAKRDLQVRALVVGAGSAGEEPNKVDSFMSGGHTTHVTTLRGPVNSPRVHGEVRSAKLIEAFLYLVHADDSPELQESIVRITERWGREPLAFVGHLEILNSLVNVGIDDRKELVRIFQLIRSERDLANNRGREALRSGKERDLRGSNADRVSNSGRRIYQKELMRQRRWRVATALELHELQAGIMLDNQSEREQFCKRQMESWREAKRSYLKFKGELSWAERNEESRKFWQTIDANLVKASEGTFAKSKKNETTSLRVSRTLDTALNIDSAPTESSAISLNVQQIGQRKRWVLDRKSMTLEDTLTGETYTQNEFEEIGYVTRAGTKIEGIGFRDPNKPLISLPDIEKRANTILKT